MIDPSQMINDIKVDFTNDEQLRLSCPICGGTVLIQNWIRLGDLAQEAIDHCRTHVADAEAATRRKPRR